MGSYHINFEGKVYPCKAKVLKCPYGEAFHSNDKVELYYRLMASHGSDTEPSAAGLREIKETNRLKSLYSLSNAIESVDYPVDVIVATLREGVAHAGTDKVKANIQKWERFEHEMAEHVKFAYAFGQDVFPNWIPQRIRQLGSNRFYQQYDGKPISRSPRADRNRRYTRMAELEARMKDYPDYEKYQESMTAKNYEQSRAWMKEDFEQFSHDLNTSKMITQPIFFGDMEKAKKAIKNMDDYEILSTFDDYSVTDKEIEDNVREANYFEYKNRNDLTDGANKKLKTWYDRNKEIYNSWKINTPQRILLAMEVVKEIDNRRLLRQDTAFGALMSERKES